MHYQRFFRAVITRSLTALLFLAFLLVLAPPCRAQIEDTTAPLLTGLSFSPTSINTSTEAATVTVTVTVTDDLSGATRAMIEFFSPSGQQYSAASTNLNGTTGTTGSMTVTFPRFSEVGAWYVRDVRLWDAAGNFRWLTTQDLIDKGLPTTLVVGDGEAPVSYAAPSPGPNAANWCNTEVTVNLSATDNPGGSGVKQIQFALGGAENTGWQTVYGSSASVTISAEGTTTLSYFASDRAGNEETTKTLTVRIDKSAPLISGMPTSGCTILPPNHKLVQVATVTAGDALSGLASFNVVRASNDRDNGQIVITGGPGQFIVQLGADKGQLYALTATATDVAGNVAIKTATCSVPQNQGKQQCQL